MNTVRIRTRLGSDKPLMIQTSKKRSAKRDNPIAKPRISDNVIAIAKENRMRIMVTATSCQMAAFITSCQRTRATICGSSGLPG